MAALQAAGKCFYEERQERHTISRDDAQKRAQELFGKRGDLDNVDERGRG